MASIKHVKEKLISDAMCMIGCNDSDVYKLADIGSVAFLKAYTNHTYKQAYDYAWVCMCMEKGKLNRE